MAGNGNSNILKKVTIVLCTVNLLVASYLAGVVFGPLYFGISSSLPFMGMGSANSAEDSSRGKGEEAVSQGGEAALATATNPLIDTVKQLPLAERREDEDPEAVIMASAGDGGEGEAEAAKPLPKPRKTSEELQAMAKALPAECHAEAHADYDGFAVQWGLTHLRASLLECCHACLEQRREAEEGARKCNVWVYCPQEGGCFSPDIYDHKHQECWLKHADEPEVNFKGRYADEFRREHKTAPEFVDWMAGVL